MLILSAERTIFTSRFYLLQQADKLILANFVSWLADLFESKNPDKHLIMVHNNI